MAADLLKMNAGLSDQLQLVGCERIRVRIKTSTVPLMLED